MISHSKNFIFVHVPKTGGQTLTVALLPYAADPKIRNPTPRLPAGLSHHATLQHYKREFGTAFVRDAFKFAVVRNPWDRAISFYFFNPKRLPDAPFDEAEFRERIADLHPVQHYICGRRLDGRRRKLSKHSMQQILRTETLQTDFDEAAARLRIEPVKLEKRNTSNHRHYAEYYTPALQDFVAEKYTDEIELFGYSFGS
jgi:hypothetical protein